MERKINYVRTMIAFLVLLQFYESKAQCNQQNIKASGYLKGECNSLQFQGIIGSITSAYGSCGGLNFDPPLSGTDIKTSTINQGQGDALQIFPNPTSGTLQIQTTSSRPHDIEIYSALGKLVYSKVLIQEGINTLQIDELPAGYYFLKVTSPNTKTQIHKIIKL